MVQLSFPTNKTLRDEKGNDDIQSRIAHQIISKNQNDDFPAFFAHEAFNPLFTQQRRPFLDDRRLENFAKVHNQYVTFNYFLPKLIYDNIETFATRFYSSRPHTVSNLRCKLAWEFFTSYSY